MPREKNSATSAITASTASADRRPSSRDVSFSATIALAAGSATPASSSARIRSLFAMNGTPAASSTCARDDTSSGIAGLAWMPVKNEVVSAEISTAPARAVPTEAPRLVMVFCNPPTSALCSSGTADTVTLPSCDASAPTPSPASSNGHVTASGPTPISSAAISVTIPTNSATKPSWTTRRGDAVGKNLGTPTAARSSVIESGSIRTPVSTAESPSATDRNRGTVKNRPACSRYWKKNEVNPPRRSLLPNIVVSISVASPASWRRRSQARNPRSTTPPAATNQTTGERPNQEGALGFGLTNPQAPACRIPNTTRPSPRADRTVPIRSRRADGSAGVSAIFLASTRIPTTIKTSPANTYRHDAYVVITPPIRGPTATAMAPAAATRP